jgi:tetratricopeptide (TPR) repeat protein
MKSPFIQISVVFQLFCFLCPAEGQILSPTRSDNAEVRQKLEAFAKGDLSLDDTAPNSPEWCKKVVAYYFLHTNDISAKMKLPISRCFVVLNDFPETAKLAAEYVNVYSNDWRGWSMLGGANFAMESYNEAIKAMTNAISLGDEKNYQGLGLAALKMNRMDILRDIVVPHLLLLMDDAKEFPKEQRLGMRQVLVAYAVNADKKDIFLKALEGVDANDIHSLPNLEKLVKLACEQFSGKEIDKIRQELKAAEASNSNSATNSPTP